MEKATSPFGRRLNPLDLEEVLENVITYLLLLGNDKHKRDLLNCRLVNARWNQMVVRVMKKQGATTVLRINNSNIKEYHESLHDLTDKGSSSATTTFKSKSLLPLSTLSLVIAPPAEGSPVSVSTDETTKLAIDLLTSHKNLVVTSINYRANNNYSESEEGTDKKKNLICNLINLAWATLKALDITDHTDHDGGAYQLVRPADEFPQLKTLIYNIGHLTWQTNIRFFPFLTQLLQSSPQLREFSLLDSFPEIPDYYDFMNSQHMMSIFAQLRPTLTTTLTSLDVTLHSEAALYALCALHLQQLQALTIRQQRSLTLLQQFLRFLSFRCPALRTFDVLFLSRIIDVVEPVPEIPPQEGIENFSLQVTRAPPQVQEVVYLLNTTNQQQQQQSTPIITRQLHQAMIQFPGLRSITLNWAVVVMLAKYREKNCTNLWVRDVQFPTVSNLVLRLCIDKDAYGAINRDICYAKDWYKVVFPNVSSLTLVMECTCTHDHSSSSQPGAGAAAGVTGTATATKGPDPNLTNLISKFLRSCNQIRYLEIQNYYEDWLARIVKRDPSKFFSLAHLKLTLDPKAMDKCGCGPTKKLGFDFDGFLSAAAGGGGGGGGSLRLIEIDRRIAKSQLEQECQQLFQGHGAALFPMTEYLESKFPNTRVQLI